MLNFLEHYCVLEERSWERSILEICTCVIQQKNAAFVDLRNLSETERDAFVALLCENLGTTIDSRTHLVSPQTQSVSPFYDYSQPVLPHTDGAIRKDSFDWMILLRGEQKNVCQDLSLLVDKETFLVLLAQMDPQLSEFVFSYSLPSYSQKVASSEHITHPLVSPNGDICFAPDLLVRDELLKELEQLYDSFALYLVKLAKKILCPSGTLLCLPNKDVLHGRKALEVCNHLNYSRELTRIRGMFRE